MLGADVAPEGVAGCCAGNCARTIYYVWEHMVDFQGGHLRVNLLLNRASPWVDVHSYIPYAGTGGPENQEALPERAIACSGVDSEPQRAGGVHGERDAPAV